MTTLLSPVDEFAAGVRAALSDLPTDEVDELTDGLEADLADRLAEAGGELGDPVAYAEELRSAAGLPRIAAPASHASPGQLIRSAYSGFRRGIDASPRLRAAADAVQTLRPIWWIARSLPVTLLLVAVVVGPQNFPDIGNGYLWTTGIVVAALSIALGMITRTRRSKPARSAVLVVDILCLVALPVALGVGAATVARTSVSYVSTPSYTSGLAIDGNPVTNVFAYDANGTPLTDVRLYDQDGDPLSVNTDGSDYVYVVPSDGVDQLLVPSARVDGTSGWNVVPLQSVPYNSVRDDGTLDPNATTSPVPAPFATIQPLIGASEPQPTPTPAPTTP